MFSSTMIIQGGKVRSDNLHCHLSRLQKSIMCRSNSVFHHQQIFPSLLDNTQVCCKRNSSSSANRVINNDKKVEHQPVANSPLIGLRKVLIANRGEIACRIQRTCELWEIPTVGIYSSADTRYAYHARKCNESYLIGTGPTVQDSYLQQDAIIQLALETGCDAIHPGYGFLSENSGFAQKPNS